MSKHQTRVDQVKDGLRERVAAESSDQQVLTPRECDMVALVGQGLSNLEIGARA